jgi:hypothetical protein
MKHGRVCSDARPSEASTSPRLRHPPPAPPAEPGCAKTAARSAATPVASRRSPSAARAAEA